MKVYQFHQQACVPSNHNPSLLIGLRHRKIMINTLLRWCSAGLISAYILTVITGIYFYNQLTLTSIWGPNLILILFVLLLIWLLYVQYQYSEKKTGSRLIGDKDIKPDLFSIKDCYRNNQRLTNTYMIASLTTWLMMIGVFFSHQQMVKSVFMILGLALYSFGLFMIRGLLREKCFIRQMIGKVRSNTNHLIV
jgi:hypothetical protein